MGLRIPMPDLPPGRCQVRWYSLFTGKLLTSKEEDLGNPARYEVPSVTDGRHVLMSCAGQLDGGCRGCT